MMNILELDEVVNAPELENLMLVDCLNLAFRYKHRGMTEFASEFLQTVRSLGKSYGAKKIVLLCDKGSSAYRKAVFPEYKANRKEAYKNQTEEEAEKVAKFFEGFERALEFAQDSYPLIRYKGVEADDLAAFIVKHHKQDFKHTWLISSDADWDLLLDDNVSRFSFVTTKEYTMDLFYDQHGCETPEDYVSVKALQGDAGDGVPGIKLVGVKRAYALLREYGTAMDVYDAIPIAGNQVMIKNINDSGDLIPLNYQLMDLLSFCEDAIGDNVTDLQEQLEEIL